MKGIRQSTYLFATSVATTLLIEKRIVDWTSRVNNFNDYCGASDYNFVTL